MVVELIGVFQVFFTFWGPQRRRWSKCVCFSEDPNSTLIYYELFLIPLTKSLDPMEEAHENTYTLGTQYYYRNLCSISGDIKIVMFCIDDYATF